MLDLALDEVEVDSLTLKFSHVCFSKKKKSLVMYGQNHLYKFNWGKGQTESTKFYSIKLDPIFVQRL